MHRMLIVLLAPMLYVSSAAAQRPTPPHDHASHDSAFAAMQERGRRAMGVDQYTSTHHFDALPDGGRISLERDVDDSAGVQQIRAHIREIARAFKAGDFSTPATVHLKEVPGTKIMAERRSLITYEPRDLPRGAELYIRTSDDEARRAIHDFLAFQRSEHRG